MTATTTDSIQLDTNDNGTHQPDTERLLEAFRREHRESHPDNLESPLRLGELVRKVTVNPDIPGSQTLGRMASISGLPVSRLHALARIATQWTAWDLDPYFNPEHATPITWDHLFAVSGIDDRRTRHALLTRAQGRLTPDGCVRDEPVGASRPPLSFEQFEELVAAVEQGEVDPITLEPRGATRSPSIELDTATASRSGGDIQRDREMDRLDRAWIEADIRLREALKGFSSQNATTIRSQLELLRVVEGLLGLVAQRLPRVAVADLDASEANSCAA